MSAHRPTRRGVLILVVICLLVLFSLVAVTFALMAGNYVRSARAVKRREQNSESRRDLVDQALYALLADSVSAEKEFTATVGNFNLLGHGLLRTAYGTDMALNGGLLGQVNSVNLVDGGGPFLDLDVTFTGSAPDARAISGYYNGCLLTVRNGEASGYSMRIVAYTPGTPNPNTYATTTALIRIAIPEHDQIDLINGLPNKLNPAKLPEKAKFIINGRPGNGHGFGYGPTASAPNDVFDTYDPNKAAVKKRNYNLTAPLMVSGSSIGPVALFPNIGRAVRDGWITEKLPPGDPDQGFDVPDYRSMWLSYVIPGASMSPQIIPSFHRPELINYWRAQTSGNAPLLAARLRYSCLRPLPLQGENPEFTGSNPYLDFPGGVDPNNATDLANLAYKLAGATSGGGATVADTNCMWDVDNDGDGVADSVWVDIGLPVRPGKNGRAYKPLVAFLVRDLDGRLSLNAHGNPLHTTSAFTTDTSAVLAGNASGNTTVSTLFRGNGVGPGEINLTALLSNTEANAAMIGRVKSTSSDTFPGGDAAATATAERKQWSLKSLGLPGVHHPSSGPNAYGSPPDMWGCGTTALDPDGNPLFSFAGLAATDAAGNSVDQRTHLPYATNLVSPSPLDSLLGPLEAEFLLRPRDPDVQARIPSSGLLAALPSLNPYAAGSLAYDKTAAQSAAADFNRHLLAAMTTMDIVGVTAKAPPYLRAVLADGVNSGGLFAVGGRSGDAPVTVLDLFAAKLIANGCPASNVNNELGKLVPLEMIRGLPFNLNRPFGNGFDDNSNGTADEPAEVATEKTLSYDSSGAAQVPPGAGPVASYANDYPGPLAASPSADVGRQLYARYLYCLAMLVIDEDVYFDSANNKFTFRGDGAGDPNDFRKMFLPAGAESLSHAQRRELMTRRVAQWAVNCVDFRDSDSIMTCFVYDVNPWDGWSATATGDPATANPANGDRIVWGMEYPELVLQETLNTHDRRVRDMTTDSSGTPDHARKKMVGGMSVVSDTTLDQYAVPQGSTYIKLYCTRPTYAAPGTAGASVLSRQLPPKELYTYTQNGGGSYVPKLDLARLSPATSGGLQYPVWRIAISEPHNGGANATKSALALSSTAPESTNFQPGDLTVQGQLNDAAVVGGTSRTVAVERVIWFCNQSPAAFPAAEQKSIYFNRFGSGTAQLAGGAYAVVGPRGTTRFGANTSLNPSNQRITLSSTAVSVYNTGNTAITAAASGNPDRAVVGIVAAALTPAGWSATAADLGIGGAQGVGISISEPLQNNYYPAADQAPLTGGGGWVAGEANGYATAKDIPFDATNGNTNTGTTAALTTPLQADATLKATGTTLDYRTCYLQRLANPLAAFDAVRNPYITVDWMPMDLTTFNGFEKKPSDWDNTNPAGIGAFDPDDPNPGTPKFATRQRTGRGGGQNVLWSIDVTTPADTPTDASNSTDYFTSQLNGGANVSQALGAFSAPAFGSSTVTTGNYAGSPTSPFPWITWNNRPYSSPLELMMVPYSSPQRIMLEFSLAADPLAAVDPKPAHAAVSPYVASNVTSTFGVEPTPPALATNIPAAVQGGPATATYSHLWNFFQSNEPANSVIGYNYGLNLARIFDFVETPSPFVGTEQWFDPATLGASGSVGFKPPFNYLSRYRTPGRVNVNTIAHPAIFSAVTGITDPTQLAAAWAKYQRSLRGFDNPFMDDNYPTRFAGAFRDACGADLAPLPQLRRQAAEVTLLRSDPAAPSVPLFCDNSTTADYANVNRSAQFRYQTMMRMANLTTTRSNTLAVWVTIGLFEVDTTQNTTNGGAIGREVGSETGESVRYRGFFIIDRTQPVGFFPGDAANVDRAVLIRRYLD